MFSGEFEHTIDEKGRIIIPAKLRAELPGDEVFVTRGFDGCLFVFPPDAWKEMAERLAKLPTTNMQARFVSRMLFSGTDCRLDKQGRILIPQTLRDHADIELGSEVVIVGVNSRIELWSKPRWQALTARLETESETFAEQLGDLGF